MLGFIGPHKGHESSKWGEQMSKVETEKDTEKSSKQRVSKEDRLAEREKKLREQLAKHQAELRQIEEAKKVARKRRFAKIAEEIADEAIKLGLDEVPVQVWRAHLAKYRNELLKQ